jgi:hypothetical protein
LKYTELSVSCAWLDLEGERHVWVANLVFRAA